MKRTFYLIAILIAFSLILSGCSTLKKKSSELTHGMDKQHILELWGEPKEKVNLGISKNNYPVEVWTYYKKQVALLHKEEYCVLILVDEELYKWAVNEPEEIFMELVKLGVLNKPNTPDFTQTQEQRSRQEAVTQAEQTRQMMEIIRTYNFFQNTQRDIQTMQNIRTMQQQQQLFPPPPPIQRPASPLQKQ